MTYAQLKELRVKRKTVLDACGAILTVAGREKRDLRPEENQEFERRHAEGDAILTQIQRIEKQLDREAQLNEIRSDPRTAGREDFNGHDTFGAPTSHYQNHYRNGDWDAPTERRQESQTTRTWMMGGLAALTPEQRSLMESRTAELPPELRALSAATGAAGAYTVPQGFQFTLDVALKAYGGVIAAADYIDTNSGAVMPYPTVNDTGNSGENVGENTTATTTQDPAFGVINLSAYMFDSGIILVPIQLLQDSAFNAEQYVGDMCKTRVGRRLNAKCTTGIGTNEPMGIVNASTLGVTAAGVAAITYNELIDLEHSVDPTYRPDAGFMFNDTTLKLVKKLVDSNGRPLWIAGGVSEGIQGKRPDTLNGYPYFINQDMASPATGNKTVLFGALKKYKIRRVLVSQMVRFGERYMDKLQIGFLVYQRFDGNLIDAGTHPVKFLQQA